MILDDINDDLRDLHRDTDGCFAIHEREIDRYNKTLPWISKSARDSARLRFG